MRWHSTLPAPGTARLTDRQTRRYFEVRATPEQGEKLAALFSEANATPIPEEPGRFVTKSEARRIAEQVR